MTKWGIRLLLIIAIIAFSFGVLFAQKKIILHKDNSPLSEVLTFLRDEFNVKISFNDAKLAQYKISVHQEFLSADDALHFLIKGLPLKLELSSGVYVVSGMSYHKKVLIGGFVSDEKDAETLPYASIQINGYSFVTDQKGNFAIQTVVDQDVSIKVSYLGYNKLDTIITNFHERLSFKLKQSSIQMSEVILSANENPQPALDSNYQAGNLKLNQYVGQFLPGSSDNSVYNLLRLQPGIVAAGEQSNDLIIWGSYRGQTKLSFDGFTIFGLKNFNDNIGAINPLIAKDLNIKKGGYGVEEGDRVGGVVQITGLEGNSYKPSLKIGINNLTLNAIASTPVFKNTSLILAGRKTYFNLYDTYKFTRRGQNNNPNQFVDLTINPDYGFEDLNLKFSGKSLKGDDYFVSLFAGNDDFNSVYNTTSGNFNLSNNSQENNKQYGGSAFYNKLWGNGSITNFTVSSSGLNKYLSKIIDTKNSNQTTYTNQSDILLRNSIVENNVKLSHKLPFTTKSNLNFGLGFIENQTTSEKDSSGIRTINQNGANSRFFAYAENEYFINKKLKFIPGIRTDFSPELAKNYVQPRLAMSYQFNSAFKLSGSWGKYYQFIAYNGIRDELGNFIYQWNASDNKRIPVYNANHWVLGGTFERRQFFINTEIYRKDLNGITRFVDGKQGRRVLRGSSEATGLDILLKKQFKGSYVWAAYSLNSVLEQFPKKVGPKEVLTTERAPQDQNHEIKFAALADLKPIYISGNYVYGSGFPTIDPNDHPNNNQLSYHRFDVSGTFRLAKASYSMEAGISILNLFNTQNIKSGNLDRIPIEQVNALNVYTQAVPFTPTIFLKISL